MNSSEKRFAATREAEEQRRHEDRSWPGLKRILRLSPFLWKAVPVVVLVVLGAIAVTQWAGKSAAVERYDSLKNDSLPAARAVRDSAIARRDSAIGLLVQSADSIGKLVGVIDDFEPEVRWETRIVRVGDGAALDTQTVAFLVLDSIPYEVPPQVAKFGEACLDLRAECAMIRTRLDSLLAADSAAKAETEHVDDVTDDMTDAADKAIHGFKFSGLIPAPEVNVGVGVGVPILGCSRKEETGFRFEGDRQIETRTITTCPNVVGVLYAGVGWSFSLW